MRCEGSNELNMQTADPLREDPDGVSIAYYAIGTGPVPCLPATNAITHVELEWKVPECARRCSDGASVVTFVRYDARGFGLSTRDNVSFSLEAAEGDLDAVLNALALESCSLGATGADAMTAIAYAAHHPERVTTLVLNVPVVRGADIFGSRYDTILHLARTDWPAYVELSTSTYGRGSWITGNAFSDLVHAAMTQETAIRYYEALRDFDATALLGQVTSADAGDRTARTLFPAAGILRACCC